MQRQQSQRKRRLHFSVLLFFSPAAALEFHINPTHISHFSLIPVIAMPNIQLFKEFK
jgi:hypothetical protein